MENGIVVIIIQNMDSLSIIRYVIRSTFQNNHKFKPTRPTDSTVYHSIFSRNGEWKNNWIVAGVLHNAIFFFRILTSKEQKKKIFSYFLKKNPDDRQKFAFAHDIFCRTFIFFSSAASAFFSDSNLLSHMFFYI